MATYAIAAGVCLATGELGAIYAWFLFLGVPSLVLASGVESTLAWGARRFFGSGQPMRICWTWLAVAAACRFGGYLAAHILAPYWQSGPRFKEWGIVLGGPLALACTAFGLVHVVRLLRRHNQASQLAGHDLWVMGALTVLVARHLYEVGLDVRDHGMRDAPQVVLWFAEPLIFVVVAQSLALRRSAVRAGSGLVARCWSALAVAALLIALGDVQLWLHRTFSLTESVRAFSDPVWVVAAIVGALAPAYQIEASTLAMTWKPPR